MKYKATFQIITAAIFLAVLSTTVYAQLPKLVVGTVKNPDDGDPADKEIEYTAFMTNDTTDKQIDSVSVGGGWAVEVLYGFAGGNLPWSAGDTLTVRFVNIGGGTYDGHKSTLVYVTTDADYQDTGTTTLPVELVEFSASLANSAFGNCVQLSWKTTSESNNHGFEIQRSKDNIRFEKIGFIAGSGTTSTPRSYEFTDTDVQVGFYYYRLKQIDNDGSVCLTDAQMLEVIAPRTYALKQNFPNPFNPSTEIVYQLKESGKVTLKVYNILGREIKTLVNTYQEAGTHRLTFDATGFPSGVYFYRIRVNDFDRVRKMAILK